MDTGELQQIVQLLGGKVTFRAPVRDAIDAHERILSGFPGSALTHLVDNVALIRQTDSLEKAVGVSLRTLQRRRNDAFPQPLSPEQSGRAWKFAEILSKATRVFGSQSEAEAWLERPAIGLNQHRPIDLLASPAGVELVDDHLERIRYGVYT